MEKIELASFNFNVDEVLKGAAELKKAIDEIKRKQAELKKNNDTSSLAFVENQAALKTLNKEYNEHIKVLSESSKEAADAITREQRLDVVLNEEANTIKGLRNQNKILNRLRNETNLQTKEGVAELELLNNKLDENNNKIRENVDQYTQQKINIGNYKDSVVEALSEVDLFNGGVTGLKTSLKAAAVSIGNLTRASLAFIATPIGAVVGAIGLAFLLIKNALDRSEESTNKLKRAFAPLSGIFNAFLSTIEPVGEFLIDGIVAGLEAVEKAATSAISVVADVLGAFGFDNVAKSVDDFNQSIKDVSRESKELADAEAQYNKNRREAEIINKRFKKEAELIRQIRDDETLSIEERREANQRLSEKLQEQSRLELDIARQNLALSELRIRQEGETTQLLDERADALFRIQDIEEEIAGFVSEQLTNENSLRREAAQIASQQADDKIKKLNEELELFIAQQGIRARTLQEELELERLISDEKKKILEEELESKKISQEKYQTELLLLQQEQSQREAEILADNAQRELNELTNKIERDREAGLFLSEQEAQRQIQLNNTLLEQQKTAELVKLENGLISQQQFDDAVQQLKDANRIANNEIENERQQIEKEEALELRAIEFEEELARLEQEGATRFEIEQAQAEEQTSISQAKNQSDLDNQLISQQLFEARKTQIDQEAKRGEQQRERINAQAKLQLTAGFLSQAAGLVDQNSAAGKAIAVAQAGINTFEGISAGVKLGYPLAIPAVALAAATGGKAITDILSTEVPSATGSGNVGGGGGGANITTPTQSGTNIDLNNIDPSEITGVQNDIIQDSGIDTLPDRIADATREGAMQGTQEGSRQGIVELSENENARIDATF